MSSTPLAAGDKLIRLWPQANLMHSAKQSQREDVGGNLFSFSFFFSLCCRDTMKAIFMSWVSLFHENNERMLVFKRFHNKVWK